MTMPEVIEAGLTRTLKGRIAHDDELGIEYSQRESGELVLRLPWGPHLTGGGGGAGISVGPLAVVLDTICGIGAMAALGFDEVVATLDLRIDYARQFNDVSDCLVACRPVDILGQAENGGVLMQAEAKNAQDGSVLAYAFGRFIRRSLRNSETSRSRIAAQGRREPAESYTELMRFQDAGDGTLLMPFRPGIIGNGSLQSIHGGALAAHLQAAAQLAVDTARPGTMRLATASFNFLRFGCAAATMAKAEIERLGQSVASVRASSWQRAGRLNVTGQFTFVCDEMAEAREP